MIKSVTKTHFQEYLSRVSCGHRLRRSVPPQTSCREENTVVFLQHDLPPLIWLRAFESAARHLSFTHSATELGLTQSAVSKQIRLLEAHLHAPLFERKARGLAITKAGEAYLPKVREAFERLAAGTSEVFGQRRSEMLTIRAAVGFAVNWLSPRMKRFHRQHPDIPLRIISSVWNEDMGSERFDFEIRYGTGKWPGLKADRLTWEEITPLCAPVLLKGQAALHMPEGLRQHKLLHVLGYEEGWAIWLRAAGVEDVDPGNGFQFDNSLLAFEVAASGLGVALGRSSMASAELKRRRLVAPFDLKLPIKEAFHLVHSTGGIKHPDAEPFRQWILEEVRASK